MLFISVTVVILLHFVPNRACLDLFPAPPPLAVQSELNLIASLSLLDDFSVGLLPVQVRLCENKLDMIRRVLDATPTSYKKYDKVCVLDSYLMNFHSPHTTFGLAILNHNLGGMRGVMSQPVVRIITNPEPCITMRSYRKVTGLWLIVISICNMFSKIRYGCYGIVESRSVLLETHIRIA